MPPALLEAHQHGFDYRDGTGVDFEPYQEFMSPTETADWWHSWTGNPDTDGAEFLVFGQDGSGGLAAFWLVRTDEPLDRQPVVFLGSEGEIAVIARDLDSYLWLLADGYGPWEAARYDNPDPDSQPQPDPRLVELAQRTPRQSATEVIERARAEFPDFEELVLAQCR